MDNSQKANNAGAAAMAGVAGAVIGAGVAVAATQVLSDKKTRDKVKATLSSVKDQVLEAAEQHKINTKGGQASKMISKKSTKPAKKPASQVSM